jgi:signal transduction histidine kinase
MNRLWVRLSLTFSFLVMLGPVIVITVSNLLVRGDFFQLVIQRELTSPGGLIDRLESYYSENNSWDGVETLTQSQVFIVPNRPNGIGVVLVDEGRNFVTSSVPLRDINESIRQNWQTYIPIVINGRSRGLLGLVNIPFNEAMMSNLSNQPSVIQQALQIIVTFAFFSAFMGMTLGVIISRSLTAPLAKLTQVTRDFGRRKLGVRAEVKGSDEIQELAQAFNEMATDIENSEKLRRNLMADVAHELRTPLSVLQANLQALSDGVYPMTQEEIVKLLTQTEQLSRLVNDLRELALAEAKQLKLKMTEVNLNELIHETILDFSPIAQSHGVSMTTMDPKIPILLQADGYRLKQVLHNLVQNALTHTPKMGTVGISLELDHQHVLIHVRDTGKGIPNEHIPYIFDRFYRIDSSRNRATGGIGLGLSIVKAIVEMHHGHLIVESEGVPGKGTTFSISLPLTQPV